MSTKLEGFTEAKHRVVKAIDYRIQQLSLNGGEMSPEINKAILERVDELKKLRAFVKGMVTEAPAHSTNETSLKIIKE